MPRSRHSRWLSVAEKKKKISLPPPSVQDAASVFVIRVFASTKFHRTYKKKSSFRETLSLFKKNISIYITGKLVFFFFFTSERSRNKKKKKTAAAVPEVHSLVVNRLYNPVRRKKQNKNLFKIKGGDRGR